MAARSFRERGADSSGIEPSMKKVGLKKGGFYRHFKSKDELFVKAVARALDETGRGMAEVANSAPAPNCCPSKETSGRSSLEPSAGFTKMSWGLWEWLCSRHCGHHANKPGRDRDRCGWSGYGCRARP